MVEAAGAAGESRRRSRRARFRSAVWRSWSRGRSDVEAIDKPASTRARKALAAAARRGLAADAGRIYQPRNRRGPQVLGGDRARARASRDRTASQIDRERVTNQLTN